MIDLDRRFEPVDTTGWAARAAEELRGKTPEQLTERSLDGPSVRPLYVEAVEPTGHPGAPPFGRGSTPTREWSIVVSLTPESVSAMGEQAVRAAAQGAERLHLGPRACAHLESSADLGGWLDGIGLPVTLEPGRHAVAWLGAAHRAQARSGECELLVDPLGTLSREGRLESSIARALRQAAEVTSVAPPEWRPLFVDTRPAHEAGAAAVDELGFALATGVELLRAISEHGHPLADLPRRMRFAFALDADLFVGVAKLRAARLAWSKVLRTLGIDGPEQGMRIQAFGSERGLSSLDPHTNLLRGTASAFAAVIGSADRIGVASFDAALGAPSLRGERLALNTQHILRWESHLGHVLDPAAGSHYVEALTDELARGGWAALQEIEHLGGMGRALLDGSAAERVATSAHARRRAVDTRRRGLVGINRYPSPDDPVLEAAPASLEEAREAGPIGPSAVRAAADASERGALAEALLEHADRSLHELRGALAHGDAPTTVTPLGSLESRPFEAHRFELLRGRAASLPEPSRRALVVTVGEPYALKPRMDFTREALEVAGLRVEILDPAPDPKAALEAALSSEGAAVIAICASDEGAMAALEAMAGPMKERGARCCVVAGRPGERETALREAGADAFVFSGMDAVEVLGGVIAALSKEVRS